MTNKPLLFGVIGFVIGGFIVSAAALTINKVDDKPMKQSGMTMQDMSDALKGKSGDAYDEAFLAAMIEHHEGALDMARQTASHAKHDEIKQLSQNILDTQQKEISQMKQWQSDWGYKTTMDENAPGM